MKNIILLLLFITTNVGFSQKNIVSVLIKKTDLFTNTLIRVDCDKFESTFKKDFKTHIITDKKKLQRLFRILENLENSKNFLNVDTRIKHTICFSNKEIKVICISKFAISIDGEVKNISKSDLSFMQNM